MILLVALSAFAQEMPKWDVAGGYSFLRIEKVNLNGWSAAAAGSLSKNFSLAAEVSGHYKTQSQTLYGVNAKASFKEYNFLFGPRFSSRANSRITPFVQSLVGIGHLSGQASGSGYGTSVSFGESSNALAWASGGGLDVMTMGNLGIRAQVDYIFFRPTGGEHSNALRFMLGMVLHSARE